jgi:hypothetical protein
LVLVADAEPIVHERDVEAELPGVARSSASGYFEGAVPSRSCSRVAI